MMLGKRPVSGRPSNLDYSGARAYYACIRCGGVVWTFLFRLSFLFFLLLSRRWSDID